VVKVSIEVRSGAARFSVAVRAESIRRALSLVRERYPKGEAQVKLPIDPEGFFVEDPAASRAGPVGFEAPEPPRMAA
jgi:hypothetical protein